MATETFAKHVASMVEEGREFQTRRRSIRKDWANRSGVPVLVLQPPPKIGKTMRVNATMAADILESIDQYANAHGFNRSGFLVHAAKRSWKPTP